VTMIVRIDVRPDLNAAQPKFADATRQLLRGKIDILQWECAQTSKSFRMRANHFGNVIIENATKFERIGRLRPIAEHDRNSRQRLHRNTTRIHFLDAALGIPHVVRNLPKHPIADHHSRTALVAVLEANEPWITEPFVQIRPLARQDVSVDVDFHGDVTSDQ
jgi:hypothetical protein